MPAAPPYPPKGHVKDVRGIENRYLVLVVNIIFGASVIGWLIALYLATRKVKAPLPRTV